MINHLRDAVEILQQSEDISDHYLVLCKLHLAKAAKPTPCYKYVKSITSATKDCFINNLPDQFNHLSIPDSLEELEVFQISWKESSITYREALKAARSAYFSTLLEENKQNPRYLFETVAKLTKKKASTPEVSKQHSSNDFIRS